MLGITNEVWMATGTVVGAVGTVGIPIAGWAFSAVRAKHASDQAAIREACKNDIDKVRSEAASAAREIGKAQELVEASLKAAWVVLDDLRINGVRKQDQDRLRDEFRADMKAFAERLEKAIGDLRDDIHRERPGGA
jgi:hypothetical protein